MIWGIRPIKKTDMKKILLSIAFAIFTLTLFAQTSNLPFKAGEKIDVTLHYKWGISADIATLSFNLQQVNNAGSPNYHILLNVRTNRFFDSFYKVRDVYESKFDSNLDPVYAMRDVHEGNFAARNEYTWSADKKTLYAKVEKNTMPAPVDTSFTSKETIRDIINMIYTIRTLDINSLKAGKPATLLVAMDRNITRATISYLRNEVKQVDALGKFNAICLTMTLKNVSHVEKEESKVVVPTGDDVKNMVYIWLTDDQNRLPLFISVPISVGKMEIRANNIENVKYPLTSKVK